MKRKSVKKKKELGLISVSVKDISNKRNPQVEYNTTKEIIPQIVIHKVKVLTQEIMKIIPFEALIYYCNQLKPLIHFYVVYNNNGEYSIEVESAPAVFQYFKKEIDEITTMLDNAILSL